MIIHIIYWTFTSPRFWEWVFVQKYFGKRLVKKIIGLSDYKSDRLVSVVLPVNNGRSKGVERLVESLNNQTHKNIEYIAVDSGSTDDTVSWLRRNDFTVIEIEPSSFTHAFSRNTGASHASGEFILFVVDDVIFKDNDWIKTAIFLLEKFCADSISTRQTVDDSADAYARVLDSFLSGAQSDRPSLNVSKEGFIVNKLRSLMPLRTTFRSVSIDDTNHLVRSSSFKKILFHTTTVEDIDFAIRLTRLGMKTIYTNLISVVHYHNYELSRLKSYAKRVYLDTQVIMNWDPSFIRFSLRDSFLVAAVHVLSQILHSLSLVESNRMHLNGYLQRHAKPEMIDKADFQEFILLFERVDFNHLHSHKYRFSEFYEDAVKIFKDLLGDDPPANLYYLRSYASHFHVQLKYDIQKAGNSLLCLKGDYITLDEVKSIALFLWCNRIMSHMAQNKCFKKIEKKYNSDAWGVSDWM